MRRPLDLRHLISPGLRDLVELANTDDFDRVTEQVRGLGGCTSPVNLHGWTVTIDQTTRQVVRSYRSEDEPTGRLLTTCGNRRASRCPACSRLYAADTYHLIKAGLSGGKNVAESVRDHPRAFVTLTAPSFGPVHNRPTTDTSKPRPCACGESHPQDAPNSALHSARQATTTPAPFCGTPMPGLCGRASPPTCAGPSPSTSA